MLAKQSVYNNVGQGEYTIMNSLKSNRLLISIVLILITIGGVKAVFNWLENPLEKAYKAYLKFDPNDFNNPPLVYIDIELKVPGKHLVRFGHDTYPDDNYLDTVFDIEDVVHGYAVPKIHVKNLDHTESYFLWILNDEPVDDFNRVKLKLKDGTNKITVVCFGLDLGYYAKKCLC